MKIYWIEVIGNNQRFAYKNGHKLKLRFGDFVRIGFKGESTVGRISSVQEILNKSTEKEHYLELRNIIKKVKI